MLGEAQHVDGADDAGLGGLHGIELVVHRRRRAGQVVDLVDLHIQRKCYVVAHRLEMRIGQQMGDIVFAAGKIVIDAKNVVAFRQQSLAQVRTKESGAASDEDARACQGHSDPPPGG